MVAGGGFKGGRVVGASDAKGEYVKDRPVYPCDLIGSMYELLGIDLHAKLPHPQGLPVYVDADRGGGREIGRTTEGDHVTDRREWLGSGSSPSFPLSPADGIW